LPGIGGVDPRGLIGLADGEASSWRHRRTAPGPWPQAPGMHLPPAIAGPHGIRAQPRRTLKRSCRVGVRRVAGTCAKTRHDRQGQGARDRELLPPRARVTGHQFWIFLRGRLHILIPLRAYHRRIRIDLGRSTGRFRGRSFFRFLVMRDVVDEVDLISLHSRRRSSTSQNGNGKRGRRRNGTDPRKAGRARLRIGHGLPVFILQRMA
jgi:hypothetical protein